MRNNRGNDRNARLVPYTPKRIKGSPSKRCYVNNLPYECKWQDFKDHMKTAGNVAFVELFEDRNGKSMGCGLVEFTNDEDAKKAISTLNESAFKGRNIKVKEDEQRYYPKIPDPEMMDRGGPMGPMGPGPVGPGGPMDLRDMIGSGPGGGQISNVVFVSNLSYEVTPKFLRETFNPAGEIIKVNLERDRDGKSKGFGTVVLGNPDMAMRCIDMFDGRSIKGRRISVRLDRLTAVNVGPGGPGGPMGPGPMGPGPMGPMGGGGGPNMGGGGGAQQAQILQSIGLAAISSMLQGGGGPGGAQNILGGLFNGGAPGGPQGGSALENLLGRDAIDGLLRTQNVGGNMGGGDYRGDYRDNRDNYNREFRGPDRDMRGPDMRGPDMRGPDMRMDHRAGGMDNSRDMDRGYGPPRGGNHGGNQGGSHGGSHGGNHGGNSGGNSNSGAGGKKAKIFVRNIPFTLNNQQLRDYFRHAGEVQDVNILLDKKGDSRGCGTVTFAGAPEAERAVNMFHRSHLSGREIEVKLDSM